MQRQSGRQRGQASGRGHRRQDGGRQRLPAAEDERNRRGPCRDFQRGICRRGNSCTFAHGHNRDRNHHHRQQQRSEPEATPEELEHKALYRAWKRLIKSPPSRDAETLQQLWNGALDVLNGTEQESKQMLARDLEDDEFYGREHIRALLDLRRKKEASYTYIKLVRPFLMVMTHSSLLDCLAIDTFLGALYNFMSGSQGSRAIPFLKHVHDMLIYACGDASTSKEVLTETLVASTIALHELLQRESRFRFNDNLSELLDAMTATTQTVLGAADPQSMTIVLYHIDRSRTIMARANDLLAGGDSVQKTGHLASSYPRTFNWPQDRHDNDKQDISMINVFPTIQEILSDDSVFLPSTDLDQPHFLADPAARHIDTQFRLLRHDTFGQLNDLVGSLIHSLRDRPNAKNLDLGDFRANHYSEAHISYVSFEERRGLEMHLTFNQPLSIRKKSNSDFRKWWEESKRLLEGVLLCFLSTGETEIQQLFFIVSGRNTDPVKDNNLVQSRKHGTISARLATHDQINVERAMKLSFGKSRGHLIEFPGILPATFLPILQNLQNMQRTTRLPFRQWILPECIESSQDAAVHDIPPPLYARQHGFRFSLAPICRSTHQGSIDIDPLSPETTDLHDLQIKTDLDHGQCQALVTALTQEFACIQGPPGCGKSHLGIKLMKVLLHHRQKADLGPVVVVCYTNHALDQFLEHLLFSGVKKIVRIGGSSRSPFLENHNLRKISQSEAKTRSENYLLATQYESLNQETGPIKGDLNRLHRLGKREKWPTLQRYLSKKHPQIHAQFRRTDDAGFEIVGQHPFDIWASQDPVTFPSCRENNRAATGTSIQNLLAKARRNVNDLRPEERRSLTEYWEEDEREAMMDDLFERVRQTVNAQRGIGKVHDEIDRRVLQDADVIGLTTTGLAKRITVLERIRCKVIICEEAGEVMEPHMISTLLPYVEHFIQIGDHEQLRPQINNFSQLSLESKQGVLYQLDRSQFERLSETMPGRPRMPIAQLTVQRRMRPEISELVRRTIYPNLKDHESTLDRPDVTGMRKNVFWLDHIHPEEGQNSELHHRSHSNEWEVGIIHALVRHIVRQGVYSSNDIAVLTPYTGQLQQLRAAMRNDFEIVLSDRDQEALDADGFSLEESSLEATTSQTKLAPPHGSVQKKQLSDLLRIATVDNFQGEEAKVVIVSLVRSNSARRVGFLKTRNRINVLLSRAKHGMYLIGNADTYSNVPMWQDVMGMLRASDSVNDHLELCCPRHMDTVISVTTPEDFLTLSPEGGCQLTCTWRILRCGHKCQSKCHSRAMHDVFPCPQPCQRLHDPCKHACPKLCGEDCGQCHVKLQNFYLPCGHVKDAVPCHQTRTPDRIPCRVMVAKKVPACNHTVPVYCYVDVAAEGFNCPASCKTILPCGHACPDSCGKCSGDQATDAKSHGECSKVCGRPFSSCSHTCNKKCHDGTPCGPCTAPCEVRCEHSQCPKKCHETCDPCIQKCTWSCEHQSACRMPCSAPCSRLPCDERCSRELPCGHQCPSLCGENCPKDLCHQCGIKSNQRVDLLEMKTYAEIDIEETPIVRLGCGHFFTAESLDGMIGLQDVYTLDSKGEFAGLAEISSTLAHKIPRCPDCQCPIRQYVTQRYNRVINRAVLDEISKRFIVDGQRKLRELEDQVALMENALRQIHSASFTGHKDTRRKLISHLRRSVQDFLKNCAARHEPARKLHDAVTIATRAFDSTTIDQQMESLTISPDANVRSDQRVLSSGKVLEVKIESLILEYCPNWKESASWTTNAPKFASSPKKLLKYCSTLVKECSDANLPRLCVEASIHFGTLVRLYRSSPTFDTGSEDSTKRIETARGFLEAAIELCSSNFQNSEHLKVAAEESLKLLDSTRYEKVTTEELARIKDAMVQGHAGIATHSGHWYQCANGHPFAIGECGMPMEQARCPECGALIGGSNHQAVDGVTRATNMED